MSRVIDVNIEVYFFNFLPFKKNGDFVDKRYGFNFYGLKYKKEGKFYF